MAMHKTLKLSESVMDAYIQTEAVNYIIASNPDTSSKCCRR
jgi:hypothetical protein